MPSHQLHSRSMHIGHTYHGNSIILNFILSECFHKCTMQVTWRTSPCVICVIEGDYCNLEWQDDCFSFLRATPGFLSVKNERDELNKGEIVNLIHSKTLQSGQTKAWDGCFLLEDRKSHCEENCKLIWFDFSKLCTCNNVRFLFILQNLSEIKPLGPEINRFCSADKN